MTADHKGNELRKRFDAIYDTRIVGGGFFESDDYYRNDKERYWRSLWWLDRLNLASPLRILEIGGGQLALLRHLLNGDDCTVGDISHAYAAPLDRAGVNVVTLNLMDSELPAFDSAFDLIILLEVVEHVPVPAHAVIERIKPLLKPNGVLFLTTPNLFRLRNLVRMIRGVEFLDRFMLPQPGQGLGHQIEYSADHLKWQIERANMDVIMLEHDSLGRKGHSPKAQLGRRLLAPLEMRPIWRDGLVAAARKKSGTAERPA